MSKYSLVLRTCSNDMKAYGGFTWPESGQVKAPDWDQIPTCAKGLHGALWGEGHGALLDWSLDAKWLVVRVLTSEIVDLGGKVKFPRGQVIYCGDQIHATNLISSKRRGAIIGHHDVQGHYGVATAGDCGTATAGDCGTATAGNCGTATAGYSGTATVGYNGTATVGYNGTATAGNCGTATVGNCGTATVGNYGTATVGNYGTATVGNYGTATAGDYGTATAGHYGTATAGDYGTATAGDYGTATAGYRGTATAGENGRIQIEYWDAGRMRLLVGYIGEQKLIPNVAYRVQDGKFVN